jgi:hypothetical protein
MGNRRRQGNMTPQKVNNHTIEDLMSSEGDENSVSRFKRMMIRMFKEFKEDTQKENMDKKVKKAHEFKKDTKIGMKSRKIQKKNK